MKPDLNKIIESFNKLNDKTRYGILAGVVLLIILVDVVCLVIPQTASIANINDQIKKLADDTQQVLTDKARINLLRKNLQDARVQSMSLADKVRAFQEVPAILSTISSIANENNVKIDQLVPERSLQKVLTSDADGKYYSLPVIIKARCGYHQFGRFLNKLEGEDLYFILKEFIIQNQDNDPNTHLFSLTINLILMDKASKPA